MSNIPTLPNILPTVQHVAGVLSSVVLSSQQLLQANPGCTTDLRPIFLQFYFNPVFTLILGIPTQQTSTPTPPDKLLSARLDSITSTLQEMSQTVDRLKPKAAEVHPPIAKTPPSKS
ncbi:hypothetical protein BJV74DRAFT_990613 [Russula compacta]|nr:hypothetical protein BJV74DRAFT_990613 [Russula compacta]